MADDVFAGSNPLIAADEIGGAAYQRVKLTWGADGVAADVSASDPLPVDINSLPAANRTTDTISVALATDAIMTSLTALTPKFAKIVASSSGATTVVAAVTAKKIRVLSWQIVCNAANNVKWQSHVTPTDLTGLHYITANGGVAVNFSPVGHFETIVGEALDINLSAAQALGGSLVYIEV